MALGAMKMTGYIAELRAAERETNTSPTDPQKEVGNYKKGRITLHGLKIAIENPKGSIRRGVDPSGKAWQNTMKATYGYFVSTMATDGDAVDCFIGPDPESHFVVAIDQYKGKEFDESKFVLGCKTKDEATALYLAHYPKDWTLGPVSTTTVAQLKTWLKHGDTHLPFKGQMVKAAAFGDDAWKERMKRRNEAQDKAVAAMEEGPSKELAKKGHGVKNGSCGHRIGSCRCSGHNITLTLDIPCEECEETTKEAEAREMKKRPRVVEDDICPHCDEEIREKSTRAKLDDKGEFVRQDGRLVEIHRPCGGEILCRPPSKEEQAWLDSWGKSASLRPAFQDALDLLSDAPMEKSAKLLNLELFPPLPKMSDEKRLQLALETKPGSFREWEVLTRGCPGNFKDLSSQLASMRKSAFDIHERLRRLRDRRGECYDCAKPNRDGRVCDCGKTQEWTEKSAKCGFWQPENYGEAFKKHDITFYGGQNDWEDYLTWAWAEADIYGDTRRVWFKVDWDRSWFDGDGDPLKEKLDDFKRIGDGLLKKWLRLAEEHDKAEYPETTTHTSRLFKAMKAVLKTTMAEHVDCHGEERRDWQPVKAASALRRLLQSAGLSQAPLLGADIARKAKEGVNVMHVFDTPRDVASRAMSKLFQHRSVNAMGDGAALPTKGVNVDFSGELAPQIGSLRNKLQGPAVGRYPSNTLEGRIAIGDSKLREAQAFPELIGKTMSLAQIARKHKISARSPEELFAALGKEFDGRFIVKPDGGRATAGTALPSDLKGSSSLASLMRHGMTNNQGWQFPGHATKLVAQKRIDIAPLNRVERAANNLTEMFQQRGKLKDVSLLDKARAALGGRLPFKAQGSLSGGSGKEFRVHVVDGQVVPYATVGRGSVLANLPLRTPNMAGAEQALRQKLQGMDPSRLQGTWAFDVAKGRNADKGYHVIETNPTVMGGSGIVRAAPHVRDAIGGALQGRVPQYIKMRNALIGGGALAGTAGAANAASPAQPVT